jgi:glycine/D-amino acid oxidase-like deaminating enzyme
LRCTNSLNINVSLVHLQHVQENLLHLNLSDVAAAAYEPDYGYGSPPQTTLALAKRAADLGVEIRTQTPVLETS